MGQNGAWSRVAGDGRSTGQPLVLDDLEHQPSALRNGVLRAGFRSYSAFPIRTRDEMLGVLAVASKEVGGLSGPGLSRLLGGLGDQLAVAVENARLHGRVLDVAVVEEQERIARELHDGLAQVLGYINTQTMAVRKLLSMGRVEEADCPTSVDGGGRPRRQWRCSPAVDTIATRASRSGGPGARGVASKTGSGSSRRCCANAGSRSAKRTNTAPFGCGSLMRRPSHAAPSVRSAGSHGRHASCARPVSRDARSRRFTHDLLELLPQRVCVDGSGTELAHHA